MIYSFDIEQAKEYGIDEAIMIQNFIFWISKNKVNEKHLHEGRTWTFNSKKAFSELFPFWKEYQIKRILKSLIEKGVLVTGNYNQIAYDRTLWYAFADEEKFLSIGQNHPVKKTKLSSQKDETIQPIPDNKPDNKPDKSEEVKKIIASVVSPELQKSISEWVEERRRSKKAISSTALSKVLSRLEEWYPKDIKSQIECVENAIIGGWQGIFPLKRKAPAKREITTSEFMALSPADQERVRRERHAS